MQGSNIPPHSKRIIDGLLRLCLRILRRYFLRCLFRYLPRRFCRLRLQFPVLIHIDGHRNVLLSVKILPDDTGSYTTDQKERHRHNDKSFLLFHPPHSPCFLSVKISVGLAGRQLHIDSHALADVTLRIDRAAVVFHDGLRLRQTQSVSADPVGALIIEFKDMSRFLL